jgi:hypothetical protein
MVRAAAVPAARRPGRSHANGSRDRLPAELAPLFWDHPGRRLSLSRDQDLIVRRVAAEGGLREIRLLRSCVGDEVIREVILRTEARGLSPQRIRFWQLLIALPESRADTWVRAARAGTWAGRATR